MESNGNQNLPPICKSGCGFYGNPAFEGHCSKCYKDIIKRKNETGSPVSSSSAGRISPIMTEKEAQVTSVTSSLAHASLGSSPDSSIATTSSTTPSVETATPTVPCTSKSDSTLEEGAVGGATESASITSDSSSGASEEDKDKKPKKNRCHTCKKKVGLTGFPCRCGGLFCSTHRYSDKHECSFNYKEMAQEHIRKHNPVIVADKIQKI